MSKQDTVNFAILGAGVAADFHRQAIEANTDLGAHLAAMAHYNPERFGAISAEFGAPCMTYDEVLVDPDVNVVCICTPSGQHAEQAIAAAEAGKHVLVEKPMALSLEDADAMIDACDEAGVKLGVTLQRRAEPLFARIHDAVEGGDLGELTLGLVALPYHRSQAYFDQADWRGTWAMDGGGVLMNQGIHLVDLMVWMMGDPVSVEAYADTLRRAIEVEDTLAATLRFANGALATITATTTASPGFPHRLELYGTNGGIQVEGESVTRWVLADPGRATGEPVETGAAVGAGCGGDPRDIAPTGHINVFRDFIAALREDRAPQIDGPEGRRSLATVLAIYEAADLL
ncbi:MAG TPA: Gfo/Idh/MocA family oxidoreductase [Chloroflexi bacterium]|nr:Gfo/Idh/MocA family oxidoreductase [Chloroflexota bacterium]